MKKPLFIIAGILIIMSVFIGAKEYTAQTGQGCGSPIKVVERVNWVWQWWPNRGGRGGFIDCVGPSYYIAYRPLDIAGLGIIVSVGLIFIAKKKR